MSDKWPDSVRDALDRYSWPLRRWLCDRLVGRHAYSRNVATWTVYNGLRTKRMPNGTFAADYGFCTFYDQEAS